MEKHRVLNDRQKKSRITAVNIIFFLLTLILCFLILGQNLFRTALKLHSDYLGEIAWTEVKVQNDKEVMSLPKYINDYYILEESVTDSDIADLLAESTADTYIFGKYDELTQYILGGSYRLPEISPDEIGAELDKNRELIYEKSPVRFLSEDHKELKSALKNPLNSFNTSLEKSRLIAGARFFASLPLMIALMAALVVIFIAWSLIYVKIREKAHPAVRNFGIAVILSSALVTGICVAAVYVSQVTETIDAVKAYKAVSLEETLARACEGSAFMSAIPLIVGILLIFISAYISVKSRAKQKAAAAKLAGGAEREERRQERGESRKAVTRKAEEAEKATAEKRQPTEEEMAEAAKKKDIDDLINIITTGEKPAEEPEKPGREERQEEEAAAQDDKASEKSAEREADRTDAEEIARAHGETLMPEINSNAAVPVNGRTCPECGKVNLSRNLFCSECGALLK